jgi:hypothetical protein
MDAAESAASLAALRKIKLAGVTKVVVTTGKFDAAKSARTFNVEAGYPAYPATLQTYSRWAEVSQWPDHRFRDGYDLLTLRRILQVDDGFDIAVLYRGDEDLEARWRTLLGQVEDRAYLTFSPTAGQEAETLLLNLQVGKTRAILDAACGLYLEGRSYSVSPYSLKAVLDIATDAINLMDELDSLQGAGPLRSPTQ